MNENETEQKLLKDIRQELDRSCDRLDAATLSRLNQIRHRALETEHRAFYQRPLVLGSTLAAGMLVFMISFNISRNAAGDLEDVELMELENIEILSADEDLEFYEDIEFYQWLSMNEEL